jgi:polysaccharide export outer membrane protein
MIKPLLSTYKSIFLILVLIVILGSCVSQKKIKYLQQKQKYDTTLSFPIKQAVDYKIQPNDNLYIRIYSMDEKTNALFNRSSIQGSSSYNNAQNYFESYTVSSEGYIEFPVIGKIFVKDLTLEQSRSLIQQLVDEYLKETVVVIKMSIFNITILGEVRSPGEFQVYQDKINLFEAFSRAGDLTDFANRNKVILVRQVKNESKLYYLDLTSDKILNSEYYYLAPNDMLYVSPLRIKQYGFATFPYALVFGSITTILALLTFIKVY